MIISYIKQFFARKFSKIVEINEKYAKPRIKMTPLVAFSLVLLRFYLIFLVLILFYKFWTLVR